MTFSRPLLFAAAASLLLAAPAFAQGRPAPRGKPAAPPAEPAPPPIFPCRTAEEICFLVVGVGPQAAVIFTNAKNGEGIDAKPQDVLGPDGQKLDMARNAGRVVMLSGAYDPKVGITKAEVVEVGSPLQSLSIKAQLGGGEEPAGKKGGGAAPRRR